MYIKRQIAKSNILYEIFNIKNDINEILRDKLHK